MPAGRILCLGDDLTRGADDVGGGARTYRGALQQLLGNGGYAVDFVGPESLDPAAGGDDPEHAGFAGASIDATGNASNNLTSRLAAIRAAHPSPDLIVVGAGWWDVLNAPTNLAARFETFVGAIQSGSWASVKLLLTTLHPRRGETEAQTGGALSAYASLNTRIRSLANAGRVVADAAAFQSADRSLWLESIINNATLPPDFRTMMSGDGIPATDGGHLTTSFDGLSAYLNEHAGGNPPYPGAGPTPWPSLNSPQSMGRGHPGYLQQVSAIAPWWWNFAGPQHNATNTVLDSRNMFAMGWRKSTDSWDEFFAGARPGAVGLGQHQSVRWVSGSNETGTPHPLAASGFREDGITTWYRPHWDTGFESWPDDTSPSRGIRGFIGRARRDLMVDAKCFLWGVQVRLALLNPQGENDIARSRLLGACGGDFIVPEPRFPGAKHYDYLGFPMQVMDGGHDRWRHITSTDWVWITSCTIGGTGYNEGNPNHHYWDPGTPRPLSDNWSPMWAYNNPPAYSVTIADLRAKPPPLPSYVSGGSAGYLPTDYWTDPASGQPTVWLTQQGADKLARVMYDRIVAAGLLTGSTGSGGGSTGGLPPAVVPPGLSSPARWFARLTGGLNTWAARAPAPNQAPTWVNGVPGTVVAGQAIVGTVRATGTPAPTYSKVAGPAWLSVHPTSGVLSGTAPNIESLETVTLRATNSEGSADQTSTLRVSTAAAILTTSLPPALQNVPYNVPIELAGREPLLLEASGLPAGLSLQGRAIVGTRTDAVDALVTLTVTGPDGSATRLLPLAGGVASGAPVISTVSLGNGALGIVYRGELAALGVQPIRWGIEGTLPPGVSLLYDRKNIVPNADFATALAGWSSVGASQFLWDAGRARLRGDGLTPWCGINRILAAAAGTRYRVSVTVESLNGPLVLVGRPDHTTTAGQRMTNIGAAGRHSVDFTARTTTPSIMLECLSGTMVPALTHAFDANALGWTTWQAGTGYVVAQWAGGAIRPSWSLGFGTADPVLASPTGLAVPATNRLVQAAIRRIGRDDIGDMTLASHIAHETVQVYPQGGSATDNGDGTYTCGNGGLVRILYPLASLAVNVPYLAVLEVLEHTDPARSSTVDWCDNTGGGQTHSLSVSGPGTRASFIVSRSLAYDATYRFLDINAGAGATIRVRPLTFREIRHIGTLGWSAAELFWKRTTDPGLDGARVVTAPAYTVPEVPSLPEQMVQHSNDFANAVWHKGPNVRDDGLDGTLAGHAARRFTSLAVGNSFVAQYIPVRAVEGTVYTATFYSDRDPNAAGNGAVYVRCNGPNAQFSYTATVVSAGVWRYVCSFAIPAGTLDVMMLLVTDANNGYTYRIAAAQMSQTLGAVPYRESAGLALPPTGIFQPHNLLMSSEDMGFAPHWGKGPNLTFNGRDGTLLGRPAWKFTSVTPGNSYIGTTVSTEAGSGPLVPGRTYTISQLSTRNPAAPGNGSASVYIGGPGTWHALSSMLVAPGVWLYYVTVTLPSNAVNIWVLMAGFDAGAGYSTRGTAFMINEGAIVLPYLRTERQPIRANRGVWQTQNWLAHANSALNANGWSAFGSPSYVGTGNILQGVQSQRFSSAAPTSGYFRFTERAIAPGVPYVVAYLVRNHAGGGAIALGNGEHGDAPIIFVPGNNGQITDGPAACGARWLGDCWLVWGLYCGSGRVAAVIAYADSGTTWDIVPCVAIGTAITTIVGSGATPVGEERTWASELATVQWDMSHSMWTGTIDQIRLDITPTSSDRVAWEVDRLQIGEPGTLVIDDFECAPIGKNHVRNPSGTGALNGPLGSGGALPTNWGAGTAGLVREVTVGQSIATSDGLLEAIRMRLSGTPSQSWWVLVPDTGDAATVAPARAGEQWSAQVALEPVAGTVPPGTFWSIYVEEWRANGTWIRAQRIAYAVGPLSGPTVISGTYSTVSPDCAGVRMLLSIEAIGGGARDFTFDVGGWQLELAPEATFFAHPDRAYLYGPPALPGSYGFKARAENALGSDDQQLSITVPARGFASSPWDRFARAGA